jgi:hypothetical protein
MHAMEDAVPITAQWPLLLHIPDSARFSSSSLMIPERTFSLNLHTSLVPIFLPWNLPVSMAPPETTIVGISTLHAPITNAGVVLVATAEEYNTIHRIGAY